MRKIYEEKVNIEKCACCKRRTWHGTMWAVEVTVPGEEEPRKWHFCKTCCPTKGFTDAVAAQFDARLSATSTEG